MQAVDEAEGDEVFPEPVSGDVPAVEPIVHEEIDMEPDFDADEFQGAEGALVVADAQPEEGQLAKRLKEPYEPSAEERAAHEKTHLPYRSWCRHCVRGKGRNKWHMTLMTSLQERKPKVVFDYFYLGNNEELSLPLMAIKDTRSKRFFPEVYRAKECRILTMLSR